MNEQIKQAKDAIEKIINEIDDQDRNDIYESIKFVTSILDRNFQLNNPYKAGIEAVKKDIAYMIVNNKDTGSWGITLASVKIDYKRKVKAILREVDMIGLPSKEDFKIDKSIKIHNSLEQFQHQQQKQKIENTILLEAIRDSLTGRQLKEIEEIISTESKPEKAKPKIMEKLMSFGSSVGSDVLASVINNPNIWSSF